MKNKSIYVILIFIIFATSSLLGFDKKKYTLGIYSEFPITRGIIVNKNINNNHFFSLKYGTAPKTYLNTLGNGLESFDWWNKYYSELLTEICTDMPGLELSFGTHKFLNKESISASFGVSLFTLDYNTYGTSVFNNVLGTNLEDNRKIRIKGKLVALNVRLSKTYSIKQKWEIQPGFNIKYINSFYGVTYSDFAANDDLSYRLNNWLRNYLEGLFLPTLSLQIKYKFL